MQKSTPSFLWGQYSDSGWWYYFPVAFVLKTPLPTLILLAWAVVRLIMCAVHRLGSRSCPTMLDAAALLVPAAGYFAFALVTDINLGYRHLLPVLPFLAVSGRSRKHRSKMGSIVSCLPRLHPTQRRTTSRLFHFPRNMVNI